MFCNRLENEPFWKHVKRSLFEKTCARINFDMPFLFVKFAGILVLGMMSILNRDTTWLKKHPLKFMVECICVAIGAVVPFVTIWFLRRSRMDVSTLIMWSFVVAIAVITMHTFMELSGIYPSMFYTAEVAKNGETLKKDDDKHARVIRALNLSSVIIVIGIFIVPLLILLITGIMARDFEIIFRPQIGFWASLALFMMEGVLLAAGGGLPLLLIAKNRQAFHVHKTLLDATIMFVKFFIMHVLMQISGFYNRFFQPMNIT
jgi:hypothetical protein